MNKKQFLSELEDALRENGMSGGVINSNVSYYDSYISSRVVEGNSEEDVISNLGSGRIIAKTIVDAEKKGMKSINYTSASTNSDINSNNNYKNYNSCRTDGDNSLLGKIKSFFKKIFNKEGKTSTSSNNDEYGYNNGSYYNEQLSFDSPFSFLKYIFMNMTTRNKVKLILGIILFVAVVVLLAVFAFQLIVFSLPFILILGLIFMISSMIYRR